MSITPEILAAPGSEHAHQCALFCWAALPAQRAKYPLLSLMFAIPNGGERNIKVAGQLKVEGVKAGVLDIFLPVPVSTPGPTNNYKEYAGLWIEMKRKPNKPSPDQTAFALAMREQGYQTALCYSWQDAVAAIIDYYRVA